VSHLGSHDGANVKFSTNLDKTDYSVSQPTTIVGVTVGYRSSSWLEHEDWNPTVNCNRLISINAKFGIHTIACQNGTLVKAKICAWGTRCVNKCPIEPQNGANANLTNLALIQTTGITVYMCKENASKLRSLV
jgi:hypothetical protein